MWNYFSQKCTTHLVWVGQLRSSPSLVWRNNERRNNVLHFQTPSPIYEHSSLYSPNNSPFTNVIAVWFSDINVFKTVVLLHRDVSCCKHKPQRYLNLYYNRDLPPVLRGVYDASLRPSRSSCLVVDVTAGSARPCSAPAPDPSPPGHLHPADSCYWWSPHVAAASVSWPRRRVRSVWRPAESRTSAEPSPSRSSFAVLPWSECCSLWSGSRPHVPDCIGRSMCSANSVISHN